MTRLCWEVEPPAKSLWRFPNCDGAGIWKTSAWAPLMPFQYGRFWSCRHSATTFITCCVDWKYEYKLCAHYLMSVP
jgi:hypothetical protein